MKEIMKIWRESLVRPKDNLTEKPKTELYVGGACDENECQWLTMVFDQNTNKLQEGTEMWFNTLEGLKKHIADQFYKHSRVITSKKEEITTPNDVFQFCRKGC